MLSTVIMGIKIGNRDDDALSVQKLLTEYGCVIKTRIGLHEAADSCKSCSSRGLILLEFVEKSADKVSELEQKLSEIDSVVVKKMEFGSIS